MVVLTIVSKKNGETIFFDDPLPKVHFAKIISCCLHNSWYSLKKLSKIKIFDNGNKKDDDLIINHGFYTVKTLVDIMNKRAKEKSFDFQFIENTPAGEFLAKNPTKKIEIIFDTVSADLFTGGVQKIFGNDKKDLNLIFLSKSTAIPSTYYIHCDLIDKKQNLLNGKKSDLLAKFDVKGVSHEKVTYLSPPQEVYRECSTGDEVSSITLSVKDQYGELFDFNGLEIDYELELN